MIFLIEKCSLFYQKDIYELVKSFCPDALVGMEGQCNLDLFSNVNTYRVTGAHQEYESFIQMQVVVFQGVKTIFNSSECVEKKENTYKNRTNIKRSMARQVYKWMTSLTNKTLKWGILTGVRPVQIAKNYLNETNNAEICLKSLMSEYLMSEEKALKLIRTAQYQMLLIDCSTINVSLYIHIPFCSTKCAYCSFGTTVWKNTPLKQQDYVKTIIKELKGIASVVKEKQLNIETIYIGGGTPTALEAKNLNTLLSYVSTTFNTFEEFTVEAGRPDTMTKEKLKIIQRAGVTRLSINPQTMNNETLLKVGRTHSVDDFLSIYQLARKMGFDNINCDLIYGLPGESKHDMMRSVTLLKELNPDSITIHGLSIKKGADYSLADVSQVNVNEIEECMTFADELLSKHHYSPYYLYRQKKMLGSTENTGYCIQGKESRYNIYMMEGVQTILAAGAGSITRLKTSDIKNKIVRVANIKDPKQYIETIDEIIHRKNQMIRSVGV